MLICSLFSSYAYAAVTQSGASGIYAVDETITVTLTGSAVDKNDGGFYTWYNSSGSVMENDTYTIAGAAPYIAVVSWKVTSEFAPTNNSYGNLTHDGVFVSQEFFNTTLTGGANDLSITTVEVTSEIYEGINAGLSGVIEHQGNPVGYADICVDAVDQDGNPFSHIGCTKSEADGEFFLTGDCDPSNGWCLGGTTAVIDIDASCPLNSSSYLSCMANGVSIDYASGSTTFPIEIIDIEDKIIINQTVNITAETGVWIQNENNYRINMTPTLTNVEQENINWSIYSETDGAAFLTAGEKFRVCMYANNTFSDAVHIKMSHLHLLKYPGIMTFPLCIQSGLPCKGDNVMHIEIQNGNYIKCSTWMLVPLNVKGQNKYRINFHMNVEGYEQDFEVASDRFTIFGERTDTDYVDYLTFNDVVYTKDNVTEGEYVQLRLNITSNHPFKDIQAKIHLELQANEGGNERLLSLVDFDTGEIYNHNLDYERLFDANEEDIILTPRFKVPYGTIDQDAYDVFGTHVGLHVLSTAHGEELWTQWWIGTEPTIDITDYAIEITNITTTISNTEATACDPLTITVTYNDEVSHTNATEEEDQLYVMKGWFEDTTNDLYIDDIDIIFQPDQGTGNTFNFSTTLPYIGTVGTIESEIDIKFYIYDESNTDPDCTNCGELVFEYSGDNGDGTFNITANSSESCKYLKQSVLWEDDNLYNDYLARAALEGIENKTGTFKFEVDCPLYGVIDDPMNCVIIAQIESGDVQKEVDFTCYILQDGNRYSELNFNQMVTRYPVTLEKDFLVPSHFTGDTIATLYCEAGYYNLGSRIDTFYDTFVAEEKVAEGVEEGVQYGVVGVEPPIVNDTANLTITEALIEEIEDEEQEGKTFLFPLAIIGGLIFIILCISAIAYIEKKMKKKEIAETEPTPNPQ